MGSLLAAACFFLELAILRPTEEHLIRINVTAFNAESAFKKSAEEERIALFLVRLVRPSHGR